MWGVARGNVGTDAAATLHLRHAIKGISARNQGVSGSYILGELSAVGYCGGLTFDHTRGIAHADQGRR